MTESDSLLKDAKCLSSVIRTRKITTAVLLPNVYTKFEWDLFCSLDCQFKR